MSAATLVSQLCDLLQNERLDELSSFLKEILESNLEASDKKTVVDYIIAWLDDHVIPKNNEPLFHELIVFLSHLAPENTYETARLYFTYGKISSKGRYFLYAQDKISEIKSPNAEEYHLWGNILMELGSYISEDTFFEQAVDKYAEACRLGGSSTQLLWDFAQGWKELSDRSGEISDLKQAIDYFQKALSLKPTKAFFFVNFGQTLHSYAHLTGNPYYLREAIEMFKISLHKQQTPSGWVGYALAHIKLFELTHARADFDHANKIIEEAIAAVPSQADLWIHWGELYLKAGWQSQSLPQLEMAIEKLTSMKIQECSPLKVAALLSHALVSLGFILDDLKLLSEGKERILSVLSTVPDHQKVIHAAGSAYLAHALYFNDPKAFRKAVEFFQSGVEKDGTNTDHLFGLFQAYYGWALVEKDKVLFQKSLKMIQRLTLLRPFSAFYHMSFGIALLRFSKFETNSEPFVEEAIVKFKKSLSIREESETLFHYAHALNIAGDLTADEKSYEQASEILRTLFYKLPTDMRVVHELGISLSRFGELTSNLECLEEAIELFQTVSNRQAEDDGVLCLLGYTKLLLSELIDDPTLPAHAEKLKSSAESTLLSAAHLGNSEASYHLACLYSLTKHLDCAMEHLLRAEANSGLPSIEEVEHDAWLLNLEKYKPFIEFLTTRREA